MHDDATPIDNLPARALAAGADVLTEPQAKQLLAHYGVASPPRLVVAGTEPVIARALDSLQGSPSGSAPCPIQSPWVAKMVSATISHKSDVGGVRVGIDNLDELRRSVAELQALPQSDAVLIESMAPMGHELVLGGVRHPRFGPTLLVGLGGVFVEYMHDVALRICPITPADAHAMLDSLKSSPMLNGARGGMRANREAIVAAMCAIGGPDGLLMTHADSIAELDINPLRAYENGVLALDAHIVLSAAAREPSREAVTDLTGLLFPKAVAVAGASSNGKAFGNQYIRNLTQFGYQGAIYPVHPRGEMVNGLPSYRSLGELPESVDYAFIAVAAAQCPALLEAANGQVRFAQVMASGFGEGSDDSDEKEAALLAAAGRGGMRLLGPNCVGTHSPGGRLTYIDSADPRPGHVAMMAQSGGLSMDVLRRGRHMGIRFRSVTSVGNCADLGPAELLPWYLTDPETHVIGLYLEDARRGRALFDCLRRSRGVKPVVVLVGGRSDAGARAAQSHTGAMAGDLRAWEAFALQTGAVLCDTLGDFLQALLAFQVLQPRRHRPTEDVVLLGNGGGASVLATDAFSKAGIEVRPLPQAARDALTKLKLPDGASVANPVDIPANVMQREGGNVARTLVQQIFAHTAPGAFVIHINVPVVLGYTHLDLLGILTSATLEASANSESQSHVALVLRSDGAPEVEAAKAVLRTRALELGIAVFNEVDEAAMALGAVARFETL